jgi:hypothetical protein
MLKWGYMLRCMDFDEHQVGSASGVVEHEIRLYIRDLRW